MIVDDFNLPLLPILREDVSFSEGLSKDTKQETASVLFLVTLTAKKTHSRYF